MPNYWITTNAKFRPFSYDEMIRPVEKMYTEHSKVEEGLAELQTKAGIWEGLANKESDPETYAQYKRYADELRLAANELATQGLTATSRQNLYNMKARYASEITPIEEAYKSRREQRIKQETLLAQNPDLILDRNAASSSLDDYIRNPELTFKTINGASIRERVLQEASLLAKSMSDTDLRAMFGDNDDYLEYVKKTGYSGQAILDAISKSPNADQKLAEIANRAVQSTGVYDWKDSQGRPNQEAIDRAWQYAASGLWGASGTTETSLQFNQPKMTREGWKFQADEAQKQRDFTEAENRKSRAASREANGIYDTSDGGTINVNNGAITDGNGRLTHLYGQPIENLFGTTTTDTPPTLGGTTPPVAGAAKWKEAKDRFEGKTPKDTQKDAEEAAKKEVVFPVTGMTQGDLDKLSKETITVGDLKSKRLVPVIGISRHSDTWWGRDAFAFAATEGEDTPNTWTTDTPLKAKGSWRDDRTFENSLKLNMIRDTELYKLPEDDQRMIIGALQKSGIMDQNNEVIIPYTIAKVADTPWPSRGAEYVILTDDESKASVKPTKIRYKVDRETGKLARSKNDPTALLINDYKNTQ